MEKELKKDANKKVQEVKKAKGKPKSRGLTVKEIREERELLRENIASQFEKFRRRTGLKVTYCEYNIDEAKDIFLAIEDI